MDARTVVDAERAAPASGLAPDPAALAERTALAGALVVEAVLEQAPRSTVYAPAEPVDLRATLRPLGRGPHDPTTRWDAAGLWRTFGTPEGAATARFEQGSAGITVTCWGAGADWILAGVPELLGAGDDWSGLDVSRYDLLVQTLRRRRGMRLTRSRLVVDALVPAVIEQKVTSTEAFRSYWGLVRRFGTAPPGPAPEGMRVAPSAEDWRMIPSWEWHRLGVDPRRSRTVVEAVRSARGLERTVALGRGGPEVARRLSSIPGIGVWTAAEIAQKAHGDPDAVSVGDYNLCGMVGYALTGSKVDDDGMLELLSPWEGQRQRVVRLIESCGVLPPRRGPRATITDHRRR